MNTYNRRIKDAIVHTLDESNDTYVISKLSPIRKSKVQNGRSHSPTLESLTAVRTKLNEYLKSSVHCIPTSQTSKAIAYEESCSSESEIKIPPSLLLKSVNSHEKPTIQPSDKITYEAKQTRNGDIKQKCSVEIWLPNLYPTVTAPDDDNDRSTNGTLSPASMRTNQELPIIVTESQQSNINKVSSITAYGDSQSVNELSSNNFQTTLTPHIQHDEDIRFDRSEKRVRSSKTTSSNKSNRYKYIQTRRGSKDTLQSITTGISMTSKIVHPDATQAFYLQKMKENFGSNASTTVSDPLGKPSRAKASHRLIRTNKQFAHIRHSSEKNTHIMKDIKSHQTVAFRIILGNALPFRSADDYHIIDPKLLNCCSSNQKSLNSKVLPATHSVCKSNNHRNSTANLDLLLPSVQTKKTDDSSRNVQNKIASRLIIHPYPVENKTSSMNLSEYHPKRSLPLPLLLLRPQQRRHSILSSQTHDSTDKEPVHFRYSRGQNTTCNYPIPK